MKKYYIPPQFSGLIDISVNRITSESSHPNTKIPFVQVNGVSAFYTDRENIVDGDKIRSLLIKRTKDLIKRIDEQLDKTLEVLDNDQEN